MVITSVLAAASSLGVSVAGAFGVTLAAGSFAATALGFLSQAAIGFAINALTPKPKVEGANRGYQVNTRGSALDHQIIYGEARVGGVIVFEESVEGVNDNPDVDNQFLLRVYAHAGHEVEGYTDVYINGKKVTEWRRADNRNVVSGPDAVANGVGLVPYTVCDVRSDGTVITEVEDAGSCSNRYGLNSRGAAINNLVLRFYKGDQTAADPTLVADSDTWNDSCVLNGIAYMTSLMGFDEGTYPNGPPEITVTIKGKKVYDPRETSHDPDDSSTWTWSDNTALCVRDYLSSGYGLGEDEANIDDDIVIDAADVCDQTVGGVSRYTCNGSFSTSVRPADILDDLLSSMGGLLWYSQGKWRMKPAYWTAPTLSLTEDDLRSSISLKTRHSRRDNFNIVRGTFRGPETNWQVTDYPEVTNVTDTATSVSAGSFVVGDIYKIESLGTTDWNVVAGTDGVTYAVDDYVTVADAGSGTGTALETQNAYLDADGGQESVVDLDLPFTDNSSTARRIARIFLERNRQQLTVSASFGLRAFALQVGDVVNLTVDRFGWTEKSFEVASWTFGLTDGNDLQVQMTLREISESVFDEVDDGVVFELDNSTLPRLLFVPALTFSVIQQVVILDNKPVRVITLNSEVDVGKESLIQSVIYEYKLSSDTDYQPLATGKLGDTRITTLPPGTYDFRAIPVNTYRFEGDAVTDTDFTFSGPIVNQFSYTYNGAFETLDTSGWEVTGFFNTIEVVSRDSVSATDLEKACPFEAMLKAVPADGVNEDFSYQIAVAGTARDEFVFLSWEDYIPVEPESDITFEYYQAEEDGSNANDSFASYVYVEYFDINLNKLFDETTALNTDDITTAKEYKIASVGTTDWTTWGAESNTVGVTFKSTKADPSDTTTGTVYAEASDVISVNIFLNPVEEWIRYSGNTETFAGANYIKFSVATQNSTPSLNTTSLFSGFSVYTSATAVMIQRDGITESAKTSTSTVTLSSDNVEETIATTTLTIPGFVSGSLGQNIPILSTAIGNITFSGAATVTVRLYVDGVNVATQQVTESGGFSLSDVTSEYPKDVDVELRAESTSVANISFTETSVIGTVLKR